MLHDYAHDVASRMGVSPAMTIVAGLATLAAAIGANGESSRAPRGPDVESAVHILGPDFDAAWRQEVTRHQRDDEPLTRLDREWLLQDLATRKVLEARQKKLGKNAGVASKRRSAAVSPRISPSKRCD